MEPIANILQTKVINLDEVHCHKEKLLNILKTDRRENNAESVFFKEFLKKLRIFVKIFLYNVQYSKKFQPQGGTSKSSDESCTIYTLSWFSHFISEYKIFGTQYNIYHSLYFASSLNKKLNKNFRK